MSAEKSLSETFGEEVKRRRLALVPEVSQGELANLAGVSRGTIGNLERGSIDNFNGRTRRRVSAALDKLEAGNRPAKPQKTSAPFGASEHKIRESIASQIELMADAYPEDVFPEDGDTPEARYVNAMRHAYRTAARIARGERDV